jgi:hypothetical protein
VRHLRALLAAGMRLPARDALEAALPPADGAGEQARPVPGSGTALGAVRC